MKICSSSNGGVVAIWSNVQVNLQYENGIIGHLTGSYDAGVAFLAAVAASALAGAAAWREPDPRARAAASR